MLDAKTFLETRDMHCLGSVSSKDEEKEEAWTWIGPPALGGSSFQGFLLDNGRLVGLPREVVMEALRDLLMVAAVSGLGMPGGVFSAQTWSFC